MIKNIFLDRGPPEIDDEKEIQIVRNFLEKRGYNKNVIKSLTVSPKKVKQYSKEEICNSIIIHSLSPKAYETMRKNKMTVIPLPHPKTLEARIRHFKCKPGLQDEFFKMLKMKFMSEDEVVSQAVLLFDEMAVRECFEFCERLKTVYGTHKKVQVCLLRKITNQYKK